MIKQFADPAWWSDFQTQINADDQFASSAKYFNVRVGIKTPEGSWTIDARDGKVVSVQSGLALTGDDIVLIGPVFGSADLPCPGASIEMTRYESDSPSKT